MLYTCWIQVSPCQLSLRVTVEPNGRFITVAEGYSRQECVQFDNKGGFAKKIFHLENRSHPVSSSRERV